MSLVSSCRWRFGEGLPHSSLIIFPAVNIWAVWLTNSFRGVGYCAFVPNAFSYLYLVDFPSHNESDLSIPNQRSVCNDLFSSQSSCCTDILTASTLAGCGRRQKSAARQLNGWNSCVAVLLNKEYVKYVEWKPTMTLYFPRNGTKRNKSSTDLLQPPFRSVPFGCSHECLGNPIVETSEGTQSLCLAAKQRLCLLSKQKR